MFLLEHRRAFARAAHVHLTAGERNLFVVLMRGLPFFGQKPAGHTCAAEAFTELKVIHGVVAKILIEQTGGGQELALER